MKKVGLLLLILFSIQTALATESILTCSIGTTPCTANYTILKLDKLNDEDNNWFGGYLIFNATGDNPEVSADNAYLCCKSSNPWDTLTPNPSPTSTVYLNAFKSPNDIDDYLGPNFPPRWVDSSSIPGIHNLTIGSNVKMLECGEVNYEIDCTDALYETCIGAYKKGSTQPPVPNPADYHIGLLYPCEDSLYEVDTKVCCSLTNNYDGTTDETVIYSAEVSTQCSPGGDPAKCEVGETIIANIHYTSTLNEDTFTVRMESATHPDCGINETGAIQGLIGTCTSEDCTYNYLITNIPTACAGAFMHATVGVAESNGFTQTATGTFTFGNPQASTNRRLEVESNVSQDPVTFDKNNIPPEWNQIAYSGEFICVEGRDTYASTLELKPTDQLYPYFEKNRFWPTPWGGCELDNGDSITKKLDNLVPTNPALPSGVYYLTIMGIFGPDSEIHEDIDVEVDINGDGGFEYSYYITDMFNETNANLQNLTTIGADIYTYGGCTIPEQLPLTPTSTIKITAPDDKFYYDYINISTEPNPHGLPNCTNTEMKCGEFTDNAPWPTPRKVIGKACYPTKPWPQRAMCENYNDPESPDCVYGNEQGTGLPENTCYEAGATSTTTNANGSEIQCLTFNEGHWCPLEFNWISGPGKNRCEPGPQICDYGPSQSTQYNCENLSAEGHPGFMNNVSSCLNNFNGIWEYPPNEQDDGPQWTEACCEFLRVKRPLDTDYLFFNKVPAKVY